MDASSEQQPQQQQQQSQQQMPMPPTNPQVAGRRPNNNNYYNNNNNNINNNNNTQSKGRGGRGDGGRRAGGNGGRGGRGGGGRGGRSPPPPPGRGNNNNFVANKIAPSTGVPFGHVPAYLPGSSSLVEELDQRIMIVLRDGRHLVGTLRSFDQFSNMVLDNASERRFHNQSNSKIIDEDGNTNNSTNKKITYFTDVPLGMYIVRGDSVVLLGQVGSEEEEENNNAVSQQHTAMIVSMKRLQLDEFEAMVAANEDDDKAVAEVEVAGEDESKSLEWDFDKDLLA